MERVFLLLLLLLLCFVLFFFVGVFFWLVCLLVFVCFFFRPCFFFFFFVLSSLNVYVVEMDVWWRRCSVYVECSNMEKKKWGSDCDNRGYQDCRDWFSKPRSSNETRTSSMWYRVVPGDRNHCFWPSQRVSKHTLMKSETQPASVVSINH